MVKDDVSLIYTYLRIINYEIIDSNFVNRFG